MSREEGLSAFSERLGWAVTMIGLPFTLLALVGVLVWWFVTSIGG